MLTYHKTTEEEKYSITNWKYEGKYSIYNEKPYEEHKRNRTANDLAMKRPVSTL